VDANRAGLESSRGVVRQKLGKVQITGAPPNTTVTIGAAAARRLPPDGAVWVNPGAVTVTLEAPGFRTATRPSTVSEGGSTTVAAALVATATVTATPTSGATTATATPSGTAASGQTAVTKTVDVTSPAQGATGDAAPAGAEQGDGGNAALRVTGLAVAGGGVVLVVGGFVLRHMSSTKVAAISSDAAAGRPYNPDNGNWQTLDRTGIAFLAVGGAAVVTGAVLYLMNRGGDDPTPAATARLDRDSLANRLSVAWTPDHGLRLGYAAAF
jgi:hypothetical protein